MGKKSILFVLLIGLLILSLTAFTACNNKDDPEDPNDGKDPVSDELTQIPVYTYPAETDISLAGYEDEFCKFSAALLVAYYPADIYDDEYQRFYEMFEEEVEEMFVSILPTINKSGLTQAEVGQLADIIGRAGDWMKTTKGGAVPQGFGYDENMYLLANADALEHILGFAKEIVDLIPPEKVGAFFYNIAHGTFATREQLTYEELLADARQRGFTEVVTLMEEQGDLTDSEDDIISDKNDYLFAAAIVWDLAATITDFDAAKLAQVIAFALEVNNLEDPLSILDGSQFSYKDIVSNLNIAGEVILALETAGHKYWTVLCARAVEIYEEVFSSMTGALLSGERLGILDSISQNNPFALVKLAGVILRDLKVADASALYADYDDLEKADEGETDAKLAVLVARVAGIVNTAFQQLNATDKARLSNIAKALEDSVKISYKNVPPSYVFPDFAGLWTKLERFASFGDPDSLTGDQKTEIAGYVKAVSSMLSGDVPQSVAVIEPDYDVVSVRAGTTLEEYVQLVNNGNWGLDVSVSDYTPKTEGGYNYYYYSGTLELSASMVSGWSSAAGKHTIKVTFNNSQLENVSGTGGYPARTFEATVEITVFGETSAGACTGYYAAAQDNYIVGQQIPEDHVYGYFLFESKRTFDLSDAEEVRFFGFDTSVAGENKIAYGIADFEDAGSIAFHFLYTVFAPSTIVLDEEYTYSASTYYMFVPQSTGWYNISSSGVVDSLVRLFDEQIEQLDMDDDSGDLYNFSLSRFLTAGKTYYFYVSAYSGTGYTFSLTLDQFEALVPGQTYGFSGDDGVYYMFTPASTGFYSIASNGSGGVPTVELYDHNFEFLISNVGGGGFDNFLLGYFLTAGQTYYYRVLVYGGTNYTFSLTEEHINTIDVGQTYDYTGSDVVRYMFTPAASGYYFIESSGSEGDPMVTLYDEDLESLAMDDDSGEDFNFLLGYLFTAGETYYFFVSAYSESSCTFSLAEEQFDTVAAGQTYIYSGVGTVRYLFTPATSGYYVIASSGSGADPIVELFDQNLRYLDSDDDDGEGLNFLLRYSFTAGETYILSLRDYYQAGYTFVITQEV